MNDPRADDEGHAVLLAIADLLIAEQGRISARPPDDNEKKRMALAAIRNLICPHKELIKKINERSGVKAAVTVLDAIISAYFSVPVPCLRLSELISSTGLEYFCTNDLSKE